ncbi:hypothetical protein CAPTEDRAFT_210437 [Capitella teleta]|uniref:Uncharacterized protein n=1 Tax=Capitella teleta TaxID=283909 RepID=R7TSN7_CAPTE|nr:hypothetical protein CAPTEDRAFT_210437 [Capitella teleta]|eukprot:ELT96622.1 hypothetical protein CAPTEDRAFT_210437 [Capitella teleta]
MDTDDAQRSRLKCHLVAMETRLVNTTHKEEYLDTIKKYAVIFDISPRRMAQGSMPVGLPVALPAAPRGTMVNCVPGCAPPSRDANRQHSAGMPHCNWLSMVRLAERPSNRFCNCVISSVPHATTAANLHGCTAASIMDAAIRALDSASAAVHANIGPSSNARDCGAAGGYSSSGSACIGRNARRHPVDKKAAEAEAGEPHGDKHGVGGGGGERGGGGGRGGTEEATLVTLCQLLVAEMPSLSPG